MSSSRPSSRFRKGMDNNKRYGYCNDQVESRYKAGCILVNEKNELLVVHEVASNFWGFPKGRRRKDEPLPTAALRELREEAGLKLDKSLLTMRLRGKGGTLFVIKNQSSVGINIDGKEIDQYEWISFDELKKRSTSKFTQSFFEKLNNVLK